MSGSPTASTGRWRDLGLRTASAVVLAPLALAALWLGGFPFTLLLLIATVGLSFEWAALMVPRPERASGGRATWRMLGGLLYILLPMAGLAFLRSDATVGRANTLFLVLLVWATDIGAYIAGRALGGPKLAPAISPGKTITGALGGLAAALGVGIGAWALQGGSIIQALGVSVALSVVAQLGDLGESALKRRLGVKDSGAAIPGHGGLFDRLDGLLAAAPLAALLALAAGAGVVVWG